MSEFKLGGPLLKSPDSTEHLPDLWLSAFFHKHLDSKARSNLAVTCSTGLSLFLQEWTQATLTVAVRADERPEALSRRLNAAKGDLAQRGTKPTTLALQQQGSSPEGEAWWVTYLAGLASPDPVPHITLSLQLQRIPAELIEDVGAAFPGLQSLALRPSGRGEQCTVQLPPPATLPTLRHLTIDSCSAAVWPSVGPYLPQLISLTIPVPPFNWDGGHPRPQWASIFQTPHRTLTLKQLSVPTGLEPWLTVLLGAHAPGIEVLTVQGHLGRTAGGPGLPRDAACSWRRLRVAGMAFELDRTLAWLPLPKEGPLVIEATRITIVLGLTEEAAQKLGAVRFQGCNTLQIQPGAFFQFPSTPPNEQPAALSYALSHLTHIQTPELQVKVQRLTMTPALAACLADAHAAGWQNICLEAVNWPAADAPAQLAPAAPTRQPSQTPPPALTTPLPPLQSCVSDEPLTDTLLAALLRWVTAAGILHVPKLQLQAPLPAGAAVPWKALLVGAPVELSVLVQHAALLQQCERVSVGELHVAIGTHEVAAHGGIESLTQLLSTLHITHIGVGIVVRPAVGVSGYHQPRVLGESLALIHALPRSAVELRGWAVTDANVQALSALPAWQSLTLGLHGQGQPQCSSLNAAPRFIPRSFTLVRLDARSLVEPQVEGFLRRLPTDRTAEHPLKVAVVPTMPYYCASRMQALEIEYQAVIDEQRPHPHVTVTVAR